jgi:hypothetical protein
MASSREVTVKNMKAWLYNTWLTVKVRSKKTGRIEFSDSRLNVYVKCRVAEGEQLLISGCASGGGPCYETASRVYNEALTGKEVIKCFGGGWVQSPEDGTCVPHEICIDFEDIPSDVLEVHFAGTTLHAYIYALYMAGARIPRAINSNRGTTKQMQFELVSNCSLFPSSAKIQITNIIKHRNEEINNIYVVNLSLQEGDIVSVTFRNWAGYPTYRTAQTKGEADVSMVNTFTGRFLYEGDTPLVEKLIFSYNDAPEHIAISLGGYYLRSYIRRISYNGDSLEPSRFIAASCDMIVSALRTLFGYALGVGIGPNGANAGIAKIIMQHPRVFMSARRLCTTGAVITAFIPGTQPAAAVLQFISIVATAVELLVDVQTQADLSETEQALFAFWDLLLVIGSFADFMCEGTSVLHELLNGEDAAVDWTQVVALTVSAKKYIWKLIMLLYKTIKGFSSVICEFLHLKDCLKALRNKLREEPEGYEVVGDDADEEAL